MQNPLCKYSKLLGEAGSTDGLRKYRLFGISILDVTVTVICAILFARAFGLPYIQTMVAIFILGIFVHRAFCVRTTVDKIVFG